MADFVSQLEERISKAEKTFHDKGEQIAQLSEQRGAIDRDIQRLQAEQMELRGAYNELKKMRDENAPTKDEVN